LGRIDKFAKLLNVSKIFKFRKCKEFGKFVEPIQRVLCEAGEALKIGLEHGRKVLKNVVRVIKGEPELVSVSDIAALKVPSEHYKDFGELAESVVRCHEVVDKVLVDINNLIDSAKVVIKGKNTPVGRAFQKHSIRKGSAFVGEITGNAAKNTEQGMKYLYKILNSSDATFTLRDTNAYGRVLDVRLSNGMGARWLEKGEKFIGFLEPSKKT
jgi:hypothetical protein